MKSNEAVSLLLETVKKDRKCEDVNIQPYWCTVKRYEDVEVDKVLSSFVLEQSILTINNKIAKDRANE